MIYKPSTEKRLVPRSISETVRTAIRLTTTSLVALASEEIKAGRDILEKLQNQTLTPSQIEQIVQKIKTTWRLRWIEKFIKVKTILSLIIVYLLASQSRDKSINIDMLLMRYTEDPTNFNTIYDLYAADGRMEIPIARFDEQDGWDFNLTNNFDFTVAYSSASGGVYNYRLTNNTTTEVYEFSSEAFGGIRYGGDESFYNDSSIYILPVRGQLFQAELPENVVIRVAGDGGYILEDVSSHQMYLITQAEITGGALDDLQRFAVDSELREFLSTMQSRYGDPSQHITTTLVNADRTDPVIMTIVSNGVSLNTLRGRTFYEWPDVRFIGTVRSGAHSGWVTLETSNLFVWMDPLSGEMFTAIKGGNEVVVNFTSDGQVITLTSFAGATGNSGRSDELYTVSSLDPNSASNGSVPRNSTQVDLPDTVSTVR